MATNFKEAIETAGCEYVTYDPNGDVQKQTNMVNDAIAAKCDAIIMLPMDKVALIPAVKKGHEAGVKMIMMSGDLDTPGQQYRDFFGGPNDTEAGQKAGEAIIAKFPDGATGVEIMGNAGEDPAVKRETGFEEAIKGSKITLLDKQNCKSWDPAVAMSLTEDFITKYGDKIQFIYSHWDNASVSIVQALESKDLLNKVYIVSVDGCRAGFDLVKNDKIAGTMFQNMRNQARICTDAAVKLLNGEKLTETTVYDPWIFVTKDKAGFDPGW
jgi:ribose transport system substrate-binding protein